MLWISSLSVGIGRHLLDAAANAARPEAAQIIIWFSQFSISLHKSSKEFRDYSNDTKVRWLLYAMENVPAMHICVTSSALFCWNWTQDLFATGQSPWLLYPKCQVKSYRLKMPFFMNEANDIIWYERNSYKDFPLMLHEVKHFTEINQPKINLPVNCDIFAYICRPWSKAPFQKLVACLIMVFFKCILMEGQIWGPHSKRLSVYKSTNQERHNSVEKREKQSCDSSSR